MRIKAIQGTYDYTFGKVYNIVGKDNDCYILIDDRGNHRNIYDKACYGEWAIILPQELNKNIKTL